MARNEEKLIAYTIRHYRSFCERVVLHDNFSSDRTREIASSLGADVVDFDTGNTVNDIQFKVLKDTCWKCAKADLALCADADEFLYFPQGAASTLTAYLNNRVAIVKPHGFEMFSETYPTTEHQIYDELKVGAPEDKWYAKPILFNLWLVREMNFTVGAHTCDPVLCDGRRPGNPTVPSTPPTYLLHYHHIGPIEDIARKYDEHRQRMSEINKRNNWGWHGNGLTHAREKRAAILPHLKQIIQ